MEDEEFLGDSSADGIRALRLLRLHRSVAVRCGGNPARPAGDHALDHFRPAPLLRRRAGRGPRRSGNLVTAAGVTAGIDGALILTALLRGDRVAQEIHLAIE
jgi:hypothetical protein